MGYSHIESKILEGFDMVRLYIDDVLVITKHNFADYLKVLENFLHKLEEEVLKLKTEIFFS